MSATETDGLIAPEYVKRWICIYPVYVDALNTLFEGRKISKTFCIDKPSVQEVAEACVQLGLETFVEPEKRHPRDIFRKGRVRVRMFDEQHRTLLPDIDSRKYFLTRRDS
eukprot:jgi/Galph1/1886/GphlegSOOS_G559.1